MAVADAVPLPQSQDVISKLIMKYAIQKSNFDYEIHPTETTLEELIEILRTFGWDKELGLYHENKSIDKIFPTLDVEDKDKEGSFFCSYIDENIFEVSFLDPDKRPEGAIRRTIHRILNPGGDFHVFENCDFENVISLLRLWHQHTDSELLAKLRENKIEI